MPTVAVIVVIGRPGIANAFPIGGPARTKVFVNFGRTVKSYDRARRSSKSYGEPLRSIGSSEHRVRFDR